MTFHPAPDRSHTITVTGKLLHEPGWWGSNRPVRRSAIINFMVREPTPSGQEHALGFAMTDGDGNFSVIGDAQNIPAHVTDVEDFLSIQYIPHADPDNPENTTLDGLRWGVVPTQDIGTMRFNWTPAEPYLAELDGRWIADTQDLADQLAEHLMLAQPKPFSARTLRIVLLREPSEADEFTRAQLLFKDLTQGSVRKDFPALFWRELQKIPMFRIKKQYPDQRITPYDTLLNALFKISKFQLHHFERGRILEVLIKAIGSALRRDIEKAVVDPMPDAAAVCAFIYIAGEWQRIRQG